MNENVKTPFQVSLFQLYPTLLFFITVVFALCYGNPQYAGGFNGSTNIPAFAQIVWMPLVFGTLSLCSIFSESLLSGRKLAIVSLSLSVGHFAAIIGAIVEYFLDFGPLDDNQIALPRLIASFLLLAFGGVLIAINAKRFSAGTLFAVGEEWKEDLLAFFGAAFSSLILLSFLFSVDRSFTYSDASVGLQDDTAWAFLWVSTALVAAMALLSLYYFFGSKKLTLGLANKRLLYASVISCVAPFISIFVSANSLGKAETYQAYYWSLFVNIALCLFFFAGVAYFGYRQKRYS
jgi:hypothetical protein